MYNTFNCILKTQNSCMLRKSKVARIFGGQKMNVTSTKVETNVIELKVEVSADRVDKAIQKAYKKVSRDITLPGFRTGKAPRRLLESRFGVEIFYDDAIDFLLNETYPEAVQESGIDPVDQPEITEANIEQGQPFTYTAKVVVKPEVVLGQYTGIKASKEVEVITAEKVDEELQKMCEKHSRLESVEDAAQNGDSVVIDYEGFVDEVAFAGGAAENYMLELGSNSFIPGYEEQLVGATASSDLEVKVTFPDPYQSEELAGKEAIFKVHVHEVKRKAVPELDNDFVLEVSEFETVEELRNDVMQKMEENAKYQADMSFRNEVLGKVVDASETEIPDIMIEAEIDAIINESSRNLQSYGISVEQYMEMIGKSMEEYRQEMRSEAERRVKTDLVLDKIVKTENIELNEDQFENRIEDMAKAYNQKVKDIKKMFKSQPNSMNQLKDGWKKDSAIELITEKAVVIEAKQGNNEVE
jgi:trigger factor